jgi:hypothetical protein
MEGQDRLASLLRGRFGHLGRSAARHPGSGAHGDEGRTLSEKNARAFCMTVTPGPAPREAALSAWRNPVLGREFNASRSITAA